MARPAAYFSQLGMDSVRHILFRVSRLVTPDVGMSLDGFTLVTAIGVQAIRLVGFLKLGLHLKELGARKWESWVLWGLLLFSAVLMFLTNAVSTGILRPIPSIEALSFCYRRQ